jgi:SH3 domain-containing YSC84-like protein 1
MFRSFSLALCFALTTVSLVAQDKEQGRLENAGLVMEEILNLPESIPEELLQKAECVIVVPSVTKVALGIGGSYGRGAMVCRSGENFDGAWGAPAMYALEGAASACSSVRSPRTS